MNFYIKTFGCQMNKRDSEKVYCMFKENGFLESNINDADIIVINSCAVREKSEKKLLSEIGRVRNFNKKAKIVAMGCVAQYNYKQLSKVCDFVVGTTQIEKIADIMENSDDKAIYVSNDKTNDEHIIGHKKSASAYVDIMYGCNNFCTYCIVPYTRGREVYRQKDDIIDEIKSLIDSGTKEIILLGQNVNSYKHNNGYYFVDLLYDIDKIKGLERLRFITPHPKDFSKDLVIAMKSLKNVCEHIHLPVQSGSNRILKAMHRGYTKEEYLEKIHMVKDFIPDISITTDIIVGFPTETEDDFKETFNLVNYIGFDTSFSFKYSKRPFTKAANIQDNVSDDVSSERLSLLQALQANITQKHLKSYEYKIVEVLVEGNSKRNNMFYGRNCHNIVVNFELKTINIQDIYGSIVNVYITKALKHSLVGEVCDSFRNC